MLMCLCVYNLQTLFWVFLDFLFVCFSTGKMLNILDQPKLYMKIYIEDAVLSEDHPFDFVFSCRSLGFV